MPRRSVLRVEPLERRDVPAALPPGILAVGADPGTPPVVILIDPATDAVVGRLSVYEDSFTGGVAAATGDVTGDGVADLVVGPRAGGGPRVQVIDGRTGKSAVSFYVYEPSFTGGITVAVGDVDGDGRADIVTGTGAGGGPRVRTLRLNTDSTGSVTGVTATDEFFAYEESFRGGVLVATGDVDGDGTADIVLGTGAGGGPRVRAVCGTAGHAELLNFFAYEDTVRTGVQVAAGDVDGDGAAEVITGPGPGGGPRVRAVGRAGDVADFLAFDPGFRGGIRVATTAGNATGRAEIVAVADGTEMRVRRFAADGRMVGETVVPVGAVPDPAARAGQLTGDDVATLLRRAAAASASRDAVIAVVDRNGRVLGVRAEGGIAPEVRNDPGTLVFAADGAVAKARTAALFANDQAPLTSRTVQFISQTTITDREVNSNPNVPDPDSTQRGPGFVAPVGTKGHFPPNVPFAPQVDLFGIEHTNRDGTFHPGADGIKGTADDVRLAERFNADPRFVPAGQGLAPMDSFGFDSRLLPGAQGRGIATLPGGVPVYKDGRLVGGVGVFFPGRTGYATEENSALGSTYDPTQADRSLEAEWIAFAAVGGYAGRAPVGTLGGVPLPAGVAGIPFGRIDLVGITLDIVGPLGPESGVETIQGVGRAVGVGDPDDGRNLPVSAGADGTANTADDVSVRGGVPVPDGWLVTPHDGIGVTAAEVQRVIADGVAQATATRAAIRLPLGSRTRMAFAVADRDGNVVGLYRMPDATVFSIDVAVAKARNVAYYADATALQPADQLPGVTAGAAFTNRTFRYLGLPRFPESVDGAAPGPFSQLTDGPFDPVSGRSLAGPLPASAFQSAVGYDAFHPGTNFHDPANVLNQNGVVFFPGSAPLYRGGELVGGFGVSGDGVDQDDVVTAGGAASAAVPDAAVRADEVVFRGVRLPYQKFNRNPEG